MPSTAPLCKVYVDALCGRAIYVHGGLFDRVAHFGFEDIGKKGLVAKLWFARPAHAELVALRCVQDFKAVRAMRPSGWIDMAPSGVVEKIKTTAALLGARWQTQEQIEADAEKVVVEVVAKVEAMRQNGGIQVVNINYKAYRLLQIQKGEPVISYSAHLADFTRSLVIKAAKESV
jgi:hypothetical protein